jgi:hypothetical protein
MTICQAAGYTLFGMDTGRDLFTFWLSLLGINDVMDMLAVVLLIAGLYVLAHVLKLAYRAWR